MEIPAECPHIAGIEKYNDETHKPTPGHRITKDQFITLCQKEGIKIIIKTSL